MVETKKEVTPAKIPTGNTSKPKILKVPVQNIPKPKPIPTKPIAKPTATPATPTKPTANTQPTVNQSPNPSQRKQPISYKYAGKESLSEIIGKSIPPQLIPTKRFSSIFGLIFLLIVVIAGFQLPFKELLAGNIDVDIDIGYPLTFLQLKLIPTDESPIRPLNLILDIILYIILAYAIDVVINLILKNPLLQTEKEKKEIPIIFKNKQQTLAEKATEKIVKPKPTQPQRSDQPSA